MSKDIDIIDYLRNAARTTPYKIEQDRLNLAVEEIQKLRQLEDKIIIDRTTAHGIVNCLELLTSDASNYTVQENAQKYVMELRYLLESKIE